MVSNTAEHGVGQLHHSHAHEEEIPGTVNLNAVEGDDTGYGQALFPVPALDPNDPLQWSNGKKTLILIVCSAYSFLGNAALSGVAPYIAIFAMQFGVTPNAASNLLTYPNLAFGFGSLVLVPSYLKFGRRPVMLASMLFFIGGLIGSSQATTFNGLMAARCIHSFGGGICEALPVQLVNDIFFLHERGERLGYYTASLCLSVIVPVASGYMLNAGHSWQLFFWVMIAFAAVLFVATVFIVEETSYNREAALAATSLTASPFGEAEQSEAGSKGGIVSLHTETVVGGSLQAAPLPRRKTFAETLSLKGRYDRDVSFIGTILRSFTYLVVPQALWVITSFGIFIGLGSFVINVTFPLLVTGPPYFWDISSTGLLSLGPFIGYIIALPLTTSSDWLAAWLTRRNGGIREAEMRLGVLVIPAIVTPAGLILYGFAAAQSLHWICYFVGAGILAWGSYFFFSFTIAYAVDSYFANTSEMLIAINIGKQAISFGFGYSVVDWVMQEGYLVVVAGIFTGVLVANNLLVVVFMLWGKNIRRFMASTSLSKLHGNNLG